MVKLVRSLWATKRRSGFIDSVRLFVKAGAGGSGFPKFGGVGGKGGDVYVEAVEDYNLKSIIATYPNKRVKAENGECSKLYQILGKPGKDLIIKAPVGVSVITDSRRVLGDLNVAKDRVLLAGGGLGGCSSNQYNGQIGIAHSITLDLKLIADIGFVGFPNAGKSTLLKAMSRASPRIANYPFTTIAPNIGIMEYKDHRQISLADLPGLIEGAHRNFGLGHRFLKHVIRTKLLMFVVDVHGFRLNPHSPFRSAFETLMLLNKEVELYQEDLLRKPAVLVLTKMDLYGADVKMKECLEKLKEISDLESTKTLSSDIFPTNLFKFNSIISVCARQALNIEHLKQELRKVIDLNYEMSQNDKNPTFLSSSERKPEKVRLV